MAVTETVLIWPAELYTGSVGELTGSDADLLARLRAGDETAIREGVNRHDRARRRIATSFVQTPSVAEEVVQETWLPVIRAYACEPAAGC
jgi:DNA-directed RNA polymerase specialized sigma24 family protein